MEDVVEKYEKYLELKKSRKMVREDKKFLLEQGFLISVEKAKEVMKDFIESHSDIHGKLYVWLIENYYLRKTDKLNYFTIKASNGKLFSFRVVELNNKFYVPMKEFFENDNIHDLPFHCNTLKPFLRIELMKDTIEKEI